MYPEKLENSSHPLFTADETFFTRGCTSLGFVERNYSILMHCQSFFEINIVLRGEGMHYVENGKLPVKAGDVFVIPPRFRHGYVGGNGFDVYHLVLSPVFFEKHYSELILLPAFNRLFKVEPAMREMFLSDIHLTLDKPALCELSPLLNSIREQSLITTPEALLTAAALSVVLICSLCSEYQNSRKNDASSTDGGKDEAFMSSVAYMYENYYRKISIEELAGTARMSRSSYQSRFKEYTGMSPGEFVIKLRCEAAASILVSSERSVADIAEEAGFYDTPHFIRCFKKRYGMSPIEYRRAHRSES